MRSTLAVVTLGLGFMALVSSGLSREEPQKTSVCALYHHSGDYDGHRVTVTARLMVSTSTLQDKNCPEAHITVTIGRPPPPAACQMRPATFGCPNDTREYIDGTFSGTFSAVGAGSQSQLLLELMMYSYQDADP
jgi:hypothetical protein